MELCAYRPECGAPFIPKRRTQRFCSPECYKLGTSREQYHRRKSDPELYAQVRASVRVYRTEHREQLTRQKRVRRKAIRTFVLQHYGGVCACCGESRGEFLSIDHINGGGRKHRQQYKYLSLSLILKQEGLPDGYRVLCHNCNQSFGIYGYCPHQRVVRRFRRLSK